MEKKPIIFGEGLFFKRPKEGAPEYVKGQLSVNLRKFFEFAQKFKGNEYLNFDLKVSKTGTLYLQLNEYGLKGNETKANEPVEIVKVEPPIEYPTEDIDFNSIPF